MGILVLFLVAVLKKVSQKQLKKKGLVSQFGVVCHHCGDGGGWSLEQLVT